LINDRSDPRRSAPIAEGKGWASHRQALKWVLQQTPDLGDDAIGRGPDEKGIAAGDGLGTLGLLAQY
jgi:hypothetical protein